MKKKWRKRIKDLEARVATLEGGIQTSGFHPVAEVPKK